MDAPDTLIADPKPQPVITDPQMDTNKIYEQEHERPQQISDNQPIQLAQNDVPTIPTSDTHHIVQAPDGAKVAFPKGTPPDTMHQEMTKWWQPHLQRTVAAWDSVRNAASNAAQAIGLPSDMPEWQKASDEFVRDPIGTTGDVVGAIIGGLAHGANAVIPSTPENNAMISRAQAEYAQGNHLAAAVTLTPLVGDGLAKAVKQAQARDYSGSLGTAAGVVAPFLTESFKGEAELPVTKEPAYAGEERRAGAPEQPAFTGTERRGALMSPTQIENNLKTGQPVTTPFDNTEGAMDTINRDLATRLEKPKSPTPAEDTAFFNKKEAEQAKPGVSVSEMSDRPEKKVLSIKVDGERAGQMSLTPAPELGEGAMEVSTAQLKPEFQGKGHGSAAYQQAIEYAKSKGAKALFSDDQVSAKADRVWESLVNRGVATKDAATGRYKIDLNASQTVGSAQGAVDDTALFNKAKDELGAGASISDIARRAQAMKIAGVEPAKAAEPQGAQGALQELAQKFPINPNNPGAATVPVERAVIGADGNPIATFTVAERDGRLRLKGINSLEPGTGAGTSALRQLTDLADKYNATMELTASPYGDETTRLDSDQLKAWYQRHGFVLEEGHDPSLGYMIREPKSIVNTIAEPMQVRHWSKQGMPLTETNPEKFGTGRAGAEKSRANEEGFVPRTYFGMEGYKEPAIQSGLEHKATLDSNAYYDKDADPHGIWKANFKPSDKASAATNAERAVKEAGYSGYYSPEQQVLASFNKVPVRVSELQDAANAFNKREGRPPIEHKEVGPSKYAKIIANEYDKLQHDPHNPEVQKTYAAMKDDIDKQWDFATNNMGVKFEPWDKEGQPYANSKEMVADVKNNHHLNFFRGGEMPADHPLAAVDPKTGFTYNEKMRAVHDLFGHAVNGNQFGPAGEERAWQEHRQMFSPEAVPAVTTETRGQNSWTNFGKHLRDEFGNVPSKGDKGYIPPADRPYAANKAGILPEWTHTPEGKQPSNTNPWAKNYSPWAADYQAQMHREIAKLHNSDGGSTYNPRMGNMNGKDAFAVPAHPELSKVIAGEKVQPGDIEAYMKQPKVAEALAADPALSVGTWAHEGKTYYDLSVAVPDRDQAIALGKKNNQIAIRDLKNGVDINTGGTGTPTILDQPNVTAKDLWNDQSGTYTSGAFMRYLAKNKLMSKAGSETLDAAAKKDFVPGWAEVSQFLTPEDRAQASKSVQKNVVDLVNKFNPEWVTDAAIRGSAAKGWYSRATALIQHMFGDEAHRFTNFVASLSPQKSVEQNFADALNFYNMWQDAGKPLGPDNEKVIRDLTERAEVGMSGQVARNQLYENLVNEVQPTGPKVSNFARNLKGEMDHVTKDRWMAYLFGNNERMFRWFKAGSPKPAAHLAADALIRAVGQSINMLPAEVQETSWSFLRTVVNLTESEKITPKEAIGRVNDQLIREGASELTRLIADSPKVQSALNRLATATGDERFRADNLQNSPRFKQLLQEHAEQPTTPRVGEANPKVTERGVKEAIKARSSLSQERAEREAAVQSNAPKAKAKPAPKKAPKDKATEFNPEDMSENVRPALRERMKNALYAKAKAELGPEATPSEVAQRAQAMKNGTPVPKTSAAAAGRSVGAASINDLNTKEDVPTFYSKAEQVINDKVSNNASGDSIKALLKNNGVKDDEMKWAGLDEFLKDKPKVSKADLQQFISENQIQLKDVDLGKPAPTPEMEKELHDQVMRNGDLYKLGDNRTPAQESEYQQGVARAKELEQQFVRNPVKYDKWTVPGERENYQEKLITLPTKESPELTALRKEYKTAASDRDGFLDAGKRAPEDVEQRFQDAQNAMADKSYEESRQQYTAPHFQGGGPPEGNVPNIVAHVRFDDRPAVDGKKTLFMEEAQSDWHSAGRHEGYKADPKAIAEAESNLKEAKARKTEFVQSVVDRINNERQSRGYLSPEEGNELRDLQAKQRSFENVSNPEEQGHLDYETRRARIAELAPKAEFNREGLLKIDPNNEQMSWKIKQSMTPEESAKFDTLNIAVNKAAVAKTELTQGAVPDAPFKQSWHELVMKRMLREAAEKGYDRLAWTTGDQQADLYDLSKHIGRIEYDPENNALHAFDPQGKKVIDEHVEPTVKDLTPYVGAEHAKNLVGKIENYHNNAPGEPDPDEFYESARENYDIDAREVPDENHEFEPTDEREAFDEHVAELAKKYGLNPKHAVWNDVTPYITPKELANGQDLLQVAEDAEKAQEENRPTYTQYFVTDQNGDDLSGPHDSQRDAEHDMQDRIDNHVRYEMDNYEAEKPDLPEISGLDLKHGGEFHRLLYDQMIPSFLKKYAKKWGAEVGTTEIKTPANQKVHSIEITPTMRQSVMKEGQPIAKKDDKKKKPFAAPQEPQVASNFRPSLAERMKNALS